LKNGFVKPNILKNILRNFFKQLIRTIGKINKSEKLKTFSHRNVKKTFKKALEKILILC